MATAREDATCLLMLMDHQDAGDVTCRLSSKHHKALQDRQRGRAGQWSPIVRGEDGGGSRDFLDGRPIHCGSALELQAIETGDDDYGSFTVWTPKGVVVRYELGWNKDKRIIILHAGVAGFSFTHCHEEWMRFRWPASRDGRR